MQINLLEGGQMTSCIELALAALLALAPRCPACNAANLFGFKLIQFSLSLRLEQFARRLLGAI